MPIAPRDLSELLVYKPRRFSDIKVRNIEFPEEIYNTIYISLQRDIYRNEDHIVTMIAAEL